MPVSWWLARAMSDDDDELCEILAAANTIAVLGIKNLETEDAHRIPKYMQNHGAKIVPK